MQVLEITETNLPMLLRFEDKNSMRFGIETRLPFLDYRFVELALGLSTRSKAEPWAGRNGHCALPCRMFFRQPSAGGKTKSVSLHPTSYGSTDIRP